MKTEAEIQQRIKEYQTDIDEAAFKLHDDHLAALLIQFKKGLEWVLGMK